MEIVTDFGRDPGSLPRANAPVVPGPRHHTKRPGIAVGAKGEQMPKTRSGVRITTPSIAVAALTLLAALGIGASPSGGAAQAPAASPTAVPDATTGTPSTRPQPSYDVIRLQQNGVVFPYVVVVDWLPSLVTTADGGAWAFFTARARTPDGADSRRVYGARFDPTRNVWLPAAPVPGGRIQFGPAAVTDRAGVVHLVYSDRTADTPDAVSTLVYTRSTADGGWDPPVPVAPAPNAGHQMLPALTIDAEDRLHLVWRDQRNVTPEARVAMETNADLLASDYVDGAWTAPVQINRRLAPDVNASWPELAVEGDRLVAVWSTYKGTTPEEMRSAARVEWSSRPLNDPAGWSAPETLVERSAGNTGGRSLDLIADPLGRGGAVLVYGFLRQQTSDLVLRRLAPGGDAWSADIPLGSGDRGYLPSLCTGRDGRTFLVFNEGHGRDVEVGGSVVPPEPGAPMAPLILTPGEDGEHGRAAVAVDADDRLWVLYMHSASGSANATEIRALRSVELGD